MEARLDARLESMYRRFTWRILSNYVTPWEFEQLKGQITNYEQWCATWSAHAARHVQRGDEALAAPGAQHDLQTRPPAATPNVGRS